MICLDYTRKSQTATPNVNERLYESHLRKLSKMDLRAQMDAKSGQLKNECKGEIQAQ